MCEGHQGDRRTEVQQSNAFLLVLSGHQDFDLDDYYVRLILDDDFLLLMAN